MTIVHPSLSLSDTQYSAQYHQDPQSLATKLTVDEFLAYLDKNPNERAELIDGQIVAMSGGTSNHSAIAINCTDIKFFLRQHKPCCFVRNSDFGVQTKKDQVRYPDFSIVCDVKGDDKLSKNPIAVGEVLSDNSTAKFDKNEKLSEYKNVHSIQEIFLISQLKKEVVVYRRGKFFGWDKEVYTQGLVEFRCIGHFMPIDEIYADVDFGSV